jgi:hypothetical protein
MNIDGDIAARPSDPMWAVSRIRIHHMNKIIAALVLAIPLSALPAEPDPVAKKEIGQLIAHLASSGCEFGRNGSWYSAARAVSHLQRKYEYLLDRDLVPNAEAFIERGASESSSSGKPYLVKCPGQPEVQSSDWFRSALATLRHGDSKG